MSGCYHNGWLELRLGYRRDTVWWKIGFCSSVALGWKIIRILALAIGMLSIFLHARSPVLPNFGFSMFWIQVVRLGYVSDTSIFYRIQSIVNDSRESDLVSGSTYQNSDGSPGKRYTEFGPNRTSIVGSGLKWFSREAPISEISARIHLVATAIMVPLQFVLYPLSLSKSNPFNFIPSHYKKAFLTQRPPILKPRPYIYTKTHHPILPKGPA